MSKVYQPTTMNAMIEQGLTLFTSVQDFLLNSWSKELMKVYRLNGMYFRGEESFPSVTAAGVEQNWVTQEDFNDDMLIMPVADPRMGNKQERIQKAQFLFDHATKNPMIASNPAVLLKITRRLFEEMEIDGIDELLPKDVSELPPPQPDPKVEAIKAKAQVDQQKVQIDAQSAAGKLKMEEARSQMHARTNAEAKRSEIQLEAMRAEAEIANQDKATESEIARENAKARHEMALEGAKARHAAVIATQKTKADIANAKAKAAAKPKPKGGQKNG
jgi:hypothetical protein